MFERACLVRYHEIGLKGRNRAQFERRFRENLGAALVGFPVSKIERIASRVAVRVTDPDATRSVAERIALIPGVQSVSPAFRVPRTQGDIEDAALLAIREAGAFTDVPCRVASLQHRLPGPEHGDEPDCRGVPPEGDRCGRQPVGTRCDRPHRRRAGERLRFVSRADGCGGPAGRYVGQDGRASVGGDRLTGRRVAHDAPRWARRRRFTSPVDHRPTMRASDSFLTSVRAWRSRAVLLVSTSSLSETSSGRSRCLCPPDLRVLLYRRMMLVVAERIARD